MKASKFLKLLEGVKPAGGGFVACCPAHDDRRASLSFRDGDRGLLVKCHAGCSIESITAALDLQVSDLFEQSSGNGRPTEKRIVAVYPYHDEIGTLLYEVVRLAPKDFRVRRPDGNGGWIWNLNGVRRVLYRLPEVMQAPDPVVLVEGCKAADYLRAHGFNATTSPGGAGKWRREYSELLKGRDVVIIPDNDKPGRNHTQEGAASLKGYAARARMLDLQGREEKWGVDDWLQNGHTPEELRELIDKAPEWEPMLSKKEEDSASWQAALQSIKAESAPREVSKGLKRFAKELSGASPLDRATAREWAVRCLKEAGFSSPAGLVDAALKEIGEDCEEEIGTGQALFLQSPEPWGEPIEGAELLADLEATFLRFLSLPENGASVALALWVLHAHTHGAGDISPILTLSSPERGCGKTTLLSVLSGLIPKPLLASNLTAAALFRAVEKYRPTLLVDEADSFLTQNDELRGILNSGHLRTSAYVLRTVGDEHEPRMFCTWSPKAIALIGDLPATLEDRSIMIRMRRCASTDRVERFLLGRDGGQLALLCQKAARWAQDNLEALKLTDPEIPEFMHGRAADNWRPLFGIVDLAGGEWPQRARSAAKAMTAKEPSSESARVLLLQDLRDLFRQRDADRLTSEEITRALAGMEERPWPEWRQGKPITPRQLASLLKAFDIAPRLVKFPDGAVARGYQKDSFWDAWGRYLAPSPPSEVLPTLPGAKTLGETSLSYPLPGVEGNGSKNGSDPHKQRVVTQVTDTNPPEGEKGEVEVIEDAD